MDSHVGIGLLRGRCCCQVAVRITTWSSPGINSIDPEVRRRGTPGRWLVFVDLNHLKAQAASAAGCLWHTGESGNLRRDLDLAMADLGMVLTLKLSSAAAAGNAGQCRHKLGQLAVMVMQIAASNRDTDPLAATAAGHVQQGGLAMEKPSR